MFGKVSGSAAIALALYALLYFGLLYHPVLIRLDDFGYLRSVAETYAMGRPYTNAWLEPYSAVTSSLSALAYAVTGHFIASTWGLHAVIALVNFLLVYRLLRFRLQPRHAAFLALGLVLFPVYAHKTSEFSGNAVTITLVLSAFLAYGSKQWPWFYGFAFLAFANRQNAIALLALPVWEFFAPMVWKHHTPQSGRDEPHSNHAEGRWLVAGFVIFVLISLLFHFSMNRTVAQDLGIYTGLSAARLTVLAWNIGFGICAALTLFSFSGWLVGGNPWESLRSNWARPLPASVATVFFAMVLGTGELPYFSFLTPLLGSLDRTFFLQYVSLAFFPIAFWTLDWQRMRPSAPLFLFASFALISGLKGNWYDFYLLDLGIAALFYRLMLPGHSPSIPGRIAMTVMGLLVAFGMVWAYGYRVLCDKQKLSVTLYEGLERTGRIIPPEMTDATFGYLGWKLVQAFIETGRPGPLSGFQGFVKRDCVVIDTEAPWRRGFKREAAPGAEPMAEGRARIGFMDLKYRVLKWPRGQGEQEYSEFSLLGEAPYPFAAETYTPDPYPLNAREWDDYVDKLKQKMRSRISSAR